MWDFFENRAGEIIVISGIIAFITGMLALVETSVVGWHGWSVYFVCVLVLTIFYCVGVYCYFLYRAYVFDEDIRYIPEELFSSFIFVATVSHVLVSFYAISGILFTITLLIVLLVVSVILFAMWHKKQIESKEG